MSERDRVALASFDRQLTAWADRLGVAVDWDEPPEEWLADRLAAFRWCYGDTGWAVVRVRLDLPTGRVEHRIAFNY